VGYWFVALTIEEALCGRRDQERVELDRSGKVLKLEGATVGKVRAVENGLSFEVKLLRLPPPARTRQVTWRRLRINGLPAARYILRVDGRKLGETTAAELNAGGFLSPDPSVAQTEKLRAAIVKKAQLFYRRWRPFNDHERHWGFIGGDFKLYDDEIAEQERIIAELRRPAAFQVEIVRKER
jgi:hypothetical protein